MDRLKVIYDWWFIIRPGLLLAGYIFLQPSNGLHQCSAASPVSQQESPHRHSTPGEYTLQCLDIPHGVPLHRAIGRLSLLDMFVPRPPDYSSGPLCAQRLTLRQLIVALLGI